MTPDRFSAVYSDADLRDFVADMARRLSPTREAAQDAEQEAWLSIAQAPDCVAVAGLKDAVITSVASAAWQEYKPSRAAKRWIALLREWEWTGAKMNGRAM